MRVRLAVAHLRTRKVGSPARPVLGSAESCSITISSNGISSTSAMPPSSFQLIVDAFDDYARQVGVDMTKNTLADALRACVSPKTVLELLQAKAQGFKDYRDGNRALINWLNPVVLPRLRRYLSNTAPTLKSKPTIKKRHWIAPRATESLRLHVSLSRAAQT